MDREQQEAFLRLLAPSSIAPQELDDEALGDEILHGLRASFQVPAGGDLPEYFRRRLVEVARKDLEMTGSFDELTDVELAAKMVEHALKTAAALAGDKKQVIEVAKFMRTKDYLEVRGWLRDAGFVASVAASDPKLAQSAWGDHTSSLSMTSDAVHLLGRAVRTSGAAGTTSTLAGPTRGRWLSGAVAPLSGALLMSGAFAEPSHADADKADGAGTKEAEKDRHKRARRSRLVQRVMAVCAYVATNGNEASLGSAQP